MRTPQILLFLLTLFTSIHALAIPTSFEEASQLFKRKGGGGGGGRGGGSSSSSSSSSSSGSSGSGGSRGSGSSSGGRSGGVAGVGPQPRAYGGGSYYGGGSTRPYPAGQARGGVNPRILPFAGIGILGAGALAYGAYYMYPYGGSWYYHNRTSNSNESHPVECYCGRYNPCGCEPRNETDYVDDVANNQTISRVADVNGTDTLLINGTLPNGTVVEEAGESLANALSSGLGQFGGWAVIGGAVAWGVWLV